MPTTRYTIGSKGKDGWKISYGGKQAGPYATQIAAIKAAVIAAHHAGKTNPAGAQVLVQRPNGEFRTKWTYGKDPYPPKG